MGRARDRTIVGGPPRWLLLALVLTAAACNPFVYRYAQDPKVEMHGDGATMAAQWNATLAAPAGTAPSPTGAVAATPALDGTSTYVHVSLASARPGAAHPWQLREGACGGAGGVVTAASPYGTLTVNDDGRAAGTATVPLRLTRGVRYHVRVGASAAEPERVVACGDLTPPTR